MGKIKQAVDDWFRVAFVLVPLLLLVASLIHTALFWLKHGVYQPWRLSQWVGLSPVTLVDDGQTWVGANQICNFLIQLPLYSFSLIVLVVNMVLLSIED